MRYYLNDSWIAKWAQKAYLDNFYLGTTDPSASTTGGTATGTGNEVELTVPQQISQHIEIYGPGSAIEKFGEGEESEILDQMLVNHNHTRN